MNARKDSEFLVDKYIGEMKELLPCGLIEKSHTGMGATHLEISCERNSIIVEPIKVTAYNKVEKHNRKSANKAFYFGSQVDGKEMVSVSDLQRYIKDEDIKFKKIVCVADSLPKVIKILEKKVNDYFLLIDEIDSIQNDAIFRFKMESCLDVYKEFKPNQRALLTATPIEFSDPAIAMEDKTLFKMKSKELRNVRVVKTFSGLSFVASTILEIIEAGGKVVVALNHIDSINAVIAEIKRRGVPDEYFGVLCSASSKEKVEKYYKELKGETYPSRINFITSAFFTGYDIEERYHLIVFSDITKPYTLLSTSQIKQIAGRCRAGELESETFVYRPYLVEEKTKKEDEITKEKLIDIANRFIKSDICIKENFKELEDYLDIVVSFKEAFVATSEEKSKNIVRRNNKGEMMISYFNIDSKLETVRKLKATYYPKSDLEAEFVAQGASITIEQLKDVEELKAPDETKSAAFFQKFCDNLKELVQLENENQITSSVQDLLNKTKKNDEEDILKFILDYSNYLEPRDILIRVLDSLLSKDGVIYRDRRKYNNLKKKMKFMVSGEDFGTRIMIKHFFAIGSVYTASEILELLKKCFLQSNIGWTVKTEVEAVRQARLLMELSRVKAKKGVLGGFRVISINSSIEKRAVEAPVHVRKLNISNAKK